MTATPRGAVDWEAIERDYRAGLLTLRAIAEKHGITHGAVNKRAKADGWPRDLTAKIRAKAQEQVSKDAVSTPVSKPDQVSERQLIDANAEAIANVIRAHRRQIGAAQTLSDRLLAELADQTDKPDDLVRLAEAIVEAEDPEEADKARNRAKAAVRRALELGSRASTLKTLTEAMKTLVTLERQAFRVDEVPAEDAGAQATVAVLTGVDEALELVRAKLAAAPT